MSNYISEFTSINGINYKVEIQTEKGNDNINFILGGNPFTTQMDSDGKTMYSPVKTTGATIEMMIKNLPFDIYSEKKQGTKVKLTNTSSNKVEWVGYTTPCAYTQGFDNELETLQIECVDGIASLKECPFRTSSKNVETFLNIIFKILKRCNCYRYLYVNDNILLSSTDTTNILSRIRVSESNFFDSKDHETQPDDDVAMDCYDVLYEIMQYMGYTIVAQGEDVFIIDYDAIRTGRRKYYRYDISGTSISSAINVELYHSYKIKEDSYSENGSSVSLTELFNQCVVEDEFREIDSLINGVDNSKNLVNITSNMDTTLKTWFKNNNRFKESEVFTVKNKNNEDESFFITIQYDYDEYPKYTHHNLYFVLGKFYLNPLISTYHYLHSGNQPHTESYYNPMCYSKLWDAKGATYVGYFTQKIEVSAYNKWRADIPSNWDAQSKEKKLEQFGKLCNISNIGNKKLVNYILCLNHLSNHIEHDKVTNYPFFKVSKNLPAVFGGSDGYIVLKGTIIRHDMPRAPFPMNGTCWRHKDTKKTSIYSNEGYVWSQLKWGNQYWKCEGDYKTQGDWVDTPSYFKIFYGDPTKTHETDDWQDKDQKFYNNCGALWGVDEDGYYIPTPNDTNLSGNIEWTIYCNKDTKGQYARNNTGDKQNSYSGHRPYVMLYKGLDITVGYSDDAMNDVAASMDTVYTNDVSGLNNVCSMDDIKFKICTFDNKTPSYSTVDYDVNGKSVYLESTYNQSTGMTLRQEEHFVMKNVSQYQEPRVIFEANLKNSIDIKPYSILTDKTLSNKYFIVDTMNVDYRFNKINIRLIEKTNQYD